MFRGERGQYGAPVVEEEYLRKVLDYTFRYLLIFSFALFAATVVSLPVMSPLFFTILYLPLSFLMAWSTKQSLRSLDSDISTMSRILMASLLVLLGSYLGSVLALSPVMLGYFCFSLTSSLLLTYAIIKYNDQFMPNNFTEHLTRSFKIITTSAITWFLAGLVMNAPMPAVMLGFSALSSYLSVMFILTSMRIALLDSKLNGGNKSAEFIAFSIFFDVLSLALDLFMLMNDIKNNTNENKEDSKQDSIYDNKYRVIFKLLSIFTDMLGLYYINKKLDSIEDDVRIVHPLSAADNNPERENSASASSASRSNPVQNGTPSNVVRGYPVSEQTYPLSSCEF